MCHVENYYHIYPHTKAKYKKEQKGNVLYIIRRYSWPGEDICKSTDLNGPDSSMFLCVCMLLGTAGVDLGSAWPRRPRLKETKFPVWFAVHELQNYCLGHCMEWHHEEDGMWPRDLSPRKGDKRRLYPYMVNEWTKILKQILVNNN